MAESFAGPFTGGISAATVFACLFFGAISGSGPATTAAVGMLMIPAMIDRGYDKGVASAITASSGSLGIIIPPSIPMVIFGISALGMQPPPEAVEKYGVFQSVSIPKLFIAGVLPGLVISGSLLIMNYIICKKRGYSGSAEGFSAATWLCASLQGLLGDPGAGGHPGRHLLRLLHADRSGHRRHLLHPGHRLLRLPRAGHGGLFRSL